MHSPPRKLTAEDQAAWRIPPAISSWKNPKGYTRPIDKLLAARPNVEDVTINDKFSQLADALHTADRHARDEVQKRAAMQQLLAEKAKAQKEEELRALAQKARNDRTAASRRRSSLSDGSRSRSRSSSVSSQDSDVRERENARKERQHERQKALRQSRMGTERRMQMLAREQNRDISEKIALGLAKPTQSSESMYDSRLFNQSSGFDSGFNEDQIYDKPLFAAQNAINSIYRPSANQDDDPEDDGGATMERISKANRFEVLGKAAKGFRGADIAEPRSGPVVFERDRDGKPSGPPPGTTSGGKEDDPFGIDDMIRDATGGGGNGKKRYVDDEDDRRDGKKARVDEDSYSD
jgi:SNW domain-containing protein 1